MEIFEHMEVVDTDGQHVGVVAAVDGNHFRLSEKDALDPRDLVLERSQVERVEDNKVWLFQKVSAVTTRAFLSPDTEEG
jgi:hypothetical protein